MKTRNLFWILVLGCWLGGMFLSPVVFADDAVAEESGDTCGNDDEDDFEDDCTPSDDDDDDDDGEEECSDDDDDEEDDDEPGCDEEDGGGNRFRAYSGNVRRTVRDLALSDGVGSHKLAFKRTFTSRWVGGIPTPMGSGGNWRHSYYWHITEQLSAGGTPVSKNGGPILVVNAPNGTQKQFDLNITNAPYFTARAKTKERILRSAADTNQFYLLRLDRTRHAFYRGPNGVYIMQGFYDRYENFYAFEYDDQSRLTRVVDPLTNHWISLEYATPTNFIAAGDVTFEWAAQGAASVSVAGSFNGWSTTANPLSLRPDGVWTGAVVLAAGSHEYKFVVDGSLWLSDTNNPFFNSFNNGNSVLNVGLELLTRVLGSDGREVGYRYSQMAVDGIAHACLEQVDYGDGSSAFYSYDPPDAGKYWRPMLASADDPMKSGIGARIAYSYQRQNDTNAGPVGVSGMIFEERNLDTSNLVARLLFDPLDPSVRIIENGDGSRKTLIYPSANQGRVAVVTNAVGDVTRRTYFSGNGMMSAFVNARGVTNHFSLTAEFGATTSVSNKFGVRSKTYTDAHYPAFVASKTDRAGRETRYFYDASNRLERVIQPNGHEKTFVRNSFGQVLEKSDCCGGGGPEIREYGALGRILRKASATGVVESFEYDAMGRVAAVIHPSGSITRTQRNWRGDVTNTLFPDNTSESFVRDRHGRVTQRTTRTGGQVFAEFDETGHVFQKQDELGNVTAFDRDMDGRAVVTTFPNGLVISNAYDAVGRKTLEVLPHSGATSTWQYGASGVTSHTDRAGATTTFEYNQRGQLFRKTDALGNATRYAYDAQGNVAFETNALGGVIRTLYDLNDRVTARYNELGELVITNTYDSMSRLVASQNQSGLITSNTYDASGRLLARHENGILTLANTYDYAGRLALQTTASGLTTSNAYDSMGNLISKTFSTDNTTETWRTDAFGLREHSNRLGHPTRYDYDAAGRRIRHTDALGRVTSFALDSTGQLLAITNALGEITRRTYDLEGNPIALIAPSGLVTQSNRYDLAGRLIHSVDAIGTTTELRYDSLGRQTHMLRAGLPLSLSQYDALGRIFTQTDANGVTISNTFDAASRPIAITMPDGTSFSKIYTNGLLAQQIDRASRVTTTQRDSHGRIINQTDNAGHSIQYRYDPSGRLTHLVDQASTTTAWGYDTEGRQTRKTYSDNSHWDYTYDPAGRLSSRTDAKNQTTYYHYDPIGNLTNINYPNDTDIVFEYDPLNRKIQMSDSIGETRYFYDSEGRLIREDGPFVNDTLHYTYTPANQLAAITSTFYRAAYTYDVQLRLQTITGLEGTHTYTYEGPSPTWRELQLANGTTATRAFDNLHRLTNITNHANSETLSSFALTLDNADQRTSVTREDGMRYNYFYDPIGQLTNAAAFLADGTPWKAYRYGYQYDATGNPLEQDKNGLVYSNSFNHLNQNVETMPHGSLAVLGRINYAGSTVTVNSVKAQLAPNLIFSATGIPFTMGSNTLQTVVSDLFGRSTNRQTSVTVSPKTYQYDANGNLTNDTRLAYYWNDENRLVEVRNDRNGSLMQKNRYDGFGRRREKVDILNGNAITNFYIYQNWLVLCVTDGAGNILETFTHGTDFSGKVDGRAGGIGGLLSSSQGGESVYFHYDINGNINQVSASNQAILAKYTYSPFGEILLKEGAFDSRFKFSTKEHDTATGFTYFGYRFYSATMGKWLNRDPIGEHGGIHLYAFIMNNAIKTVDPFGLSRFDCTTERRNRGVSRRVVALAYNVEEEECKCCMPDGGTGRYWRQFVTGTLSLSAGAGFSFDLGDLDWTWFGVDFHLDLAFNFSFSTIGTNHEFTRETLIDECNNIHDGAGRVCWSPSLDLGIQSIGVGNENFGLFASAFARFSGNFCINISESGVSLEEVSSDFTATVSASIAMAGTRYFILNEIVH